MNRYELDFQQLNLKEIFDFAKLDETIKTLEQDIIALANAEALLQERQQVLELFVRLAPAAIAMLDREMRYLAVSDLWIEYYQLEKTDIIGLTHYEVFPDIPQPWRQDYQHCLTGKIDLLKNKEDSYVHSNGRVDWLGLEVHPWRDCEGKIGGLLMLSEVITEKKLLEQKFFSSESQMRAIFEAMTDFVLTVNLTNDSMQILPTKFFDLNSVDTHNQIIEKTQVLLFDSPESDHYQTLIKLVLETQQTIDFEHSLEVNNSLMWFSVNVAPLDANTVIWVAHDVSHRKEMEQNLFAEKELAQVTLKSIGDAVITTDALGKVKYINPIAERLTGWKSTQAQGKPLLEIFCIIDQYTREAVPNPVDLVLQDNSIYKQEVAHNTLLVSRDGTEYAVEDSAAPIQDRQGNLIGAVVVFHDVTKSRHLANKISWQANHDALTRLYNRRKFEEKVDLAIQEAKSEEAHHALCYFDLDRFKVVNDTCGHDAGDELLRQITKLIKGKIRDSDVFARLGGDEFGILFHQCPIDIAEKLAERLRILVQDFRFTWVSQVFQIGVSMGLVAVDSNTVSLTSLLKSADSACYTAKNKGKNCVHLYRQQDTLIYLQHQETSWIEKLNLALKEDRFCLYMQKIMALKETSDLDEDRTKNDRCHYEILLRLTDKSGEIIAPSVFFPTAERYNLMPEIDRWVISNFLASYEAYCKQQKKRDLKPPSHIYNINLSGASINHNNFSAFLQKQLEHYAVPLETICFEITETAAISNLDNAVALIESLRKLGCSIALDNFGRGVSSLTYLKKLPIDYLKIDGSFTENIDNDSIDYATVECFNHISKVMNVKTIAEFVKDDRILQNLKQIGIDYAQGYGIERPKPLCFF